jgi:hypothetical protein
MFVFGTKNGDWFVNLRGLEKIGKKNKLKNGRKLHKSEQEMTKMNCFLTKN